MLTELHQIFTKDGVPLEGLLFRPKGGNRVAVVWVGGLNSRFSSHPERTHILAQYLNRKDIAFAIFDHRGFGIVNAVNVGKGKKKKHTLLGTGFEKFEHSILDIDAMVRFLRKQGYKKIFLLGHSTGANKAAHYIWKKRNSRLSGVGLLGPLSDIPDLRAQLKRKFEVALKTAGKMVRRGKGGQLVPPSLVNGALWSAERFWSIAREGSNEDTFPYYEQRRKFRWAREVNLPLLVLIGGKDQYANNKVLEILEAFRKQVPPKWYNGIVLRGADHSFNGKEEELAKKITNWVVSAL